MHRFIQITGRVLACCLIAAASALALAQLAAKPAIGASIPPAEVYGKLLTQMEKGFVECSRGHARRQVQLCAHTAGEFKGVRSFGQQVKHVAEANYYFFAGPSDTEAENKAKRDAIEKLTSKAEIVQALKDSFVEAHAFVDSDHSR